MGLEVGAPAAVGVAPTAAWTEELDHAGRIGTVAECWRGVVGTVCAHRVFAGANGAASFLVAVLLLHVEYNMQFSAASKCPLVAQAEGLSALYGPIANLYWACSCPIFRPSGRICRTRRFFYRDQ